jgi:hypothetical protein
VALGLSKGSFLGTTDSKLPHVITAVPELSPRIQQFQNSLAVTVATASTVDACLVEAKPAALADVEAVLTGWFPTDQPVRVVKLIQPKGTDVDPEQELTARISKFVPLATGGALAAFAFTMLWSRRSEYANYILAGATRKDVAGIHLAEITHLYFLPLAVGIFAFLLCNSSHLLSETVLLQTLLIDCTATLITASLAIPIARRYLYRIDAINALKGA